MAERFRVSVEGRDTDDALAAVATVLDQAELPDTTVELRPGEGIDVVTNPVQSASGLVDCLATYLRGEGRNLNIEIQRVTGDRVQPLTRMDGQIAASPFELLSVVVSLNPPVGMG
jgi:hypothetical protein